MLSVPIPKDDTDDPFDDLGDINDFAGGEGQRSRNRTTKKTKRRSEKTMWAGLPSFNFSPWSVLYAVVAVIGLFGLVVPQTLIWLLVFGVVFQFVTGLIGTIGVLAAIGRNSGWALVGCFVIPGWYFWCVFQYWDETKKPFILVLKGFAILIGIYLWGLIAMHAFGVKLPVNQ